MNKGISTHRLQAIATSALIVIVLTGCTHPHGPLWRKTEGAVWATVYHITYLSDKDLTDSISDTFRRVELSLSPFNNNSLIARINRGETAATDSLVVKAFGISQEVNRQSGGLFDPTVAPLVNLWGFGTDKQARQLWEEGSYTIAPERIDSALQAVGIAQCHIDSMGQLHKKHPDTTFNFSAVTKGLGCDEIAMMMRRNGVTDYLIEIGGDMALGGHNPQGEEWLIQIDAPIESREAVHDQLRTIRLTNCGVATSGNYRNFHKDGNKSFGHIINPLTGQPMTTEVLSATVIAPNAATADAWATAAMADVTLPDGLRSVMVTASADTLLVTTHLKNTIDITGMMDKHKEQK